MFWFASCVVPVYMGAGMASRFLSSRWLMLVAGIWIQITTGSSYVFGLYSEALKRALGYSQTEIDTLGFFKGIGANVGVHTGLLLLVVPPWVVLVIGAAHNLLGYLMMWFAGTHVLPHVKFWQMCVFMLIASNAQTYFNTAVVVTSVTNFPTSRGTVIGLMKGFLGLSGAVLTFFYRSLHHGDKNQISYLLFAALVPSAISVLLMFLIRPLPLLHDPYENVSLSRISGIALLLAVCLIPVTLIDMSWVLSLIFCILLLVALVSPAIVAFNAEVQNKGSDSHKQLLLGEPSNSSSHQSETTKTSNEVIISQVKIGQNFTLTQAFISVEFWLLFVAMACGMGSGLATVDNINQIGLSLGYTKRNISVAVSLFSIWNFLGRFGAGAISDIFLRSRGTPRPAFISITLGIMTLGHFMIAAGFPGALFIGTFIIGLCYGSQWSLMPATVSEIFGLKQFGTLFNTIAIASPLGTYILSVRVAGYLYDEEARRQGLMNSTSCSGPHCFRLTFVILAAVCLFGCVTTLLLVSRTKPYYTELHEKLRRTRP